MIEKGRGGIQGAEVSVASRSAVTNERGEFYFRDLPEGTVTVRARRLGFIPDSVKVTVASKGTARVELRLLTVATALSPVVVRSGARSYTGRLAGYYQRLEKGNSGYFISRQQIDRENPRMLSQLLTHVPGVTAQRMRGGGSGVRMRGRNCWPLVWLDGFSMGAGEVDLDAFVPSSLQGIELYLGSTTAPFKYIASRDQSSCGTILLWSRGPDTDPILPRITQTRALEDLVASRAVYTAEQVDKPAAQETGQHMAIVYPPALLADGVRGSVAAEFVVDTLGRIEAGSLGIIASTHPLFSEAVRQALEGATYQPALREGKPVRQVVQQPFQFTPTADRGAGRSN
ncbi:MAG: TonB family protein [Gemmatimonadales bacterium]